MSRDGACLAPKRKENFDLIARAPSARPERGKLDFVFFADAVNTGADAAPMFVVRFRPLTLLGALAVVTDRIGLVATVSTTYRAVQRGSGAALDHLQPGRIGWNVVTGSSPDAAANFSRDTIRRTTSAMPWRRNISEVAKGLWDSWEDNALVADKQTGQFIDTGKLRAGSRSADTTRSQGRSTPAGRLRGYPVIFQAGASDRGRFAGATAEVVFATQSFQEEAIAFAAKLRDRAEAAGRPRDALKILLGVSPIVGDTEREAHDIVAQLGAFVDPVTSMRVLSDRVGIDLSGYDIDGPLPDLPPSTMMQGTRACNRLHAVTTCPFGNCATMPPSAQAIASSSARLAKSPTISKPGSRAAPATASPSRPLFAAAVRAVRRSGRANPGRTRIVPKGIHGQDLAGSSGAGTAAASGSTRTAALNRLNHSPITGLENHVSLRSSGRRCARCGRRLCLSSLPLPMSGRRRSRETEAAGDDVWPKAAQAGRRWGTVPEAGSRASGRSAEVIPQFGDASQCCCPGMCGRGLMTGTVKPTCSRGRVR